MKKCITILAAALTLMLCGCNKNTSGEQSGSQEALSANFTVTPAVALLYAAAALTVTCSNEAY